MTELPREIAPGETWIGCSIPKVIQTVFDTECIEQGLTISDVLHISVMGFLDGRIVDFGRKDDLAEWQRAYQLLVEALADAAREQRAGEE